MSTLAGPALKLMSMVVGAGRKSRRNLYLRCQFAQKVEGKLQNIKTLLNPYIGPENKFMQSHLKYRGGGNRGGCPFWESRVH